MHRQLQTNNINLRRCICVEPITVPENQIEGIYEMYRRVEAVKKLGPNGLLIRPQNTQDDECETAAQLRQIITLKDQEIDDLKEARVLPLVAKCIEFYRQNRAAINQNVQQHINISIAIWDTLNVIYQQRNIFVHGPITENDIQLLHDSVQYFQRYQAPYTRQYAQAVQRLADVLETAPPAFFAAPSQYDLANLLL